MPCSLFILMSRQNGTCENSRVGEMGQIIGETGIGEMGVGETRTNRIYTIWEYVFLCCCENVFPSLKIGLAFR